MAWTLNSRYLVLSLGLMMLNSVVGVLLFSLKEDRIKASSLPLFLRLPWSRSGRQSGEPSRSYTETHREDREGNHINKGTILLDVDSHKL